MDILEAHSDELDPRISASFRAFLDLPEPPALKGRKGKAIAETPSAGCRRPQASHDRHTGRGGSFMGRHPESDMGHAPCDLQKKLLSMPVCGTDPS